MTVDSAARVWKRHAVRISDDVYELPLRFRVVPGVWPEIVLAEADGTRADVRADEHEVRLVCDPGREGTVRIAVRGASVVVRGRTVVTTGRRVPGSGPFEVVVRVSRDAANVAAGGGEPVTLVLDDEAPTVAATAVTDNVAGFRVASGPAAVGRVELGDGARLLSAVVFGLAEPRSTVHRRVEPTLDAGREFYRGATFTVSDTRVVDDGGIPALVPDSRTIVSPLRVTEEFAWRDTPYGDMTRVADRTESWHSVVEPGRFPVLATEYRSVDAAFTLALETFQRNSSDEFSLPGQTGIWGAGYFQGTGLGFGSWKRDTAHVALRAGNLLDPEVARASLAWAVNDGFDNGSDGDALPAVAIWDHVLATGDESLAIETWPGLTAAAAALDARYDVDLDLISAPQSTSNDLFDEPEAGGYALSTEIYAMQTYRALAQMAKLPHIRDEREAVWRARSDAMRRSIAARYWSAEHGYFTSGPVGTPAHTDGVWETSGVEAAVWGFLDDDPDRAASVVARSREVASSDYGLVLFPHRDDDNHFCHSVWYCWQAGFARAAARLGDAAFIHRLIGEQVRTVVLNKTFYEVTDATSGASWRWPGQLWHAAGFASLLLYGVFGISYDARGMTFAPAVAPEFAGARLDGLRFRAAVLDIEIVGHGSRCDMMLDGRPASRVAPDLVGRHSVRLVMR